MRKVLLAVFLFSLSFAAQAKEFDCSDEGIEKFITQKQEFTGFGSYNGVQSGAELAELNAKVDAMNNCLKANYSNCKAVHASVYAQSYSSKIHYALARAVGTKTSDGAVKVVELMCKQD